MAKQPLLEGKVLDAAHKALSAKPQKRWFDDGFLPCCGMLISLIKRDNGADAALVEHITTTLAASFKSDSITDPQQIVAKIRKG